MTEVKLTPALRFRGFEDEWEEKNIGQTFSIFNGYAFASLDARTEGCRWLKIADVGINYINEESPSFLPSEFSEKHKKFKLETGDYVIALTRPILNGKLKIAQVNKNCHGALLNQRVGKLQSKNDLDFVYQLLQQRDLISKIDNRIAGSDPPNLSPNEIDSIRIRIPKKEEQQKIASFLSSVDYRIQLLKQKKEKLQTYKNGVLQQIFSQQIRFKDEKGNDYPEWVEKKLGEVYEIVGGGTPETDKPEFWKGEIPWFTPTEIKSKYAFGSNRTISEKGLAKSSAKLLPVGSLLFTSRATIGECSIAKFPCSTNQGFQSFLPNKENDIEFLYYWANFNRKEFCRKSSGSTFLEISKSEITKIKINLPTLPEQQKIASFLTSLDKAIEAVQTQTDQSAEFKKGLLQQLFV